MTGSPEARVYLVEDHDVMREMIGEFLESRAGLTVVGAAATADAAFAELEGLDVELVLVDTSLPDMNGIELVRRLLDRRPDILCLMYSGHEETFYVERALEAGAKGYLVKGNPRELPGAIRQVLNGGMYLSRAVRDGKRPF
ncbi:MAG TPA: response regulator transcription factor [Gemmatimonadota bacterium]|nr:response regulator transcription factor [Gemmatimonadota bacterium]